MAINPNTQYPGQVEAPDANYTYGGAKNETVVDALDGTPFEKAMLNDVFGFQQAMLVQAGIVPSGSSETVLISQYLEALHQFMSEAKNFAINGTGVVQQRDDYTLVKDAYDFGPDRFAGMATGTLVSAGTLTQTAAANIGVTGFAHKFNQVTLTGTGILFHRARIESKDAKNFKSQKASLSCKVYHDVGAPVDYTLTVRKADAEDDFSSTTEISNDGGTSVSSAAATELKFEDISMGDCSNGIEVELKIEAGAITLKDFEQTEYDFKVGSAATPFKPEAIEVVLEKCKRYFERMDYSSTTIEAIAAGLCKSTTEAIFALHFSEKIVAPTVTSTAFGTFKILRSPADLVVDSAINFPTIGTKSMRIVATMTAGLTAGAGAMLVRDTTDTCFIDLDAEL